MDTSKQHKADEGHSQAPTPSSFWGYMAVIGPGIAIAATGVGAGDMVAAAASGARFGYAVVWAALIGALLKFILNEGLARWQLATGTTLLEGWISKLGRWVQIVFLVYLVIWSFVVGAALIAACGLAAYAITGLFSVKIWGMLHAVVGIIVVLLGQYEQFEGVMKGLIGLMFLALLGCAMWVSPPLHAVSMSLSHASIPPNGTALVLGVIGGVGGSLTLLSYGYWIKEKEWKGPNWLPLVHLDLGVAYILTGIFGASVIILGAAVLKTNGIAIKGSQGVIHMAQMLGNVIGVAGKWIFLFGFWGAVSTSLLGVWQSVPYMFCDFVGLARQLPPDEREAILSTKSKWYRGYLLWLALPPIALLYIGKPVSLIIIYSVIGALFMPFIAGTLLYMNNKKEWVGDTLRNGWKSNILLVLSLLLFLFLGAGQLQKAFYKVRKAPAARTLPHNR